MSTKHYNTDYLEDTGAFFKSLKEYSYQPFSMLKQGHIVDLGCGTGMDVITMAKLFGENISVTGIDHDLIMLNKGIEGAEGLQNADFVLSEAYPINFDSSSVSGVRAERLVQHLKEPMKVINEIHRVLQPGGPCVIVESDWPGLLFYNQHSKIEQKIIRYLSEQKVNNGYAARNLTSYLKAANFNVIKIEIFPFVLKSLKQANEYLWFDKILNETVKQQVISKDEFDLFNQAMIEADGSGYFACSMNMVVATAIK